MTLPFATRQIKFFLTAPAACPYLPDQRERKVFAHLPALDGAALNDALTHAGFRRSQSIAYRPACEACDACRSARIPAEDFTPSRNQRRILKRNADLVRDTVPGQSTREQYALLSAYLESRHADGGMAGMDFLDYMTMVHDSPVRTTLTEYRLAEGPQAGRLVACALVDALIDGFSLVYSFFDPTMSQRSLGAFMILDHIREARVQNLGYVYLGYWVAGSAKMAYKARYRPLEVLGPEGWRRLEPPPEPGVEPETAAE
ncbi:MAG: arginyltransferase [Maricaulaceae bacterium]